MFLLEINNSSFWGSLLETLTQWDFSLFLKINTQWTSPFLDSVFPWWREATTWAPLYLFLLVFVFTNFGLRSARWVLVLTITIAITDQLSSHIIKAAVSRPRPCNTEALLPYIRKLLGDCSNSYSFTSSHATNHFAAAWFLFLTLKPWLKNYSYLFFFWAATISYGQVYVGVHFPLDVICGGITGSIIGCISAWIFNKYIRFYQKNE